MTSPIGRLRTAVAAWLCFAAAFALTARAVRELAPHGSGLERMDVKFDAYAARCHEFDVVFLGSSRTVRGFVPSLFDAALAQEGVATRSFNLGVAGARAVEMAFLLERMVELRPRRLRYVLIDPEDFAQIHDTRNVLAQAGLMWHDTWTTELAVRDLWRSEGPLQLGAAWDHARAWALNSLNVGRSARWVNLALGRAPGAELREQVLGELGDGHTALFEDQDTLARRRRKFERGRAEYERMVAAYAALEPPPGPANPRFVELLERVQQRIRELGAEPVFVIQPALSRQWDLIKAAEAGVVQTLLRYDDPARYPELFAHEHRFDSLHLDDSGAERFTLALAADFAAWRRARGTDER